MGGQIETRDASRNTGLERTIRAVMSNLPPSVVYVKDIRDGVSNASEVEVRSAPI
jgi:hypothetical protein